MSSSASGGVKPMFLQAKLSRERERLHGAGMTAEERAWRAQWIKDQHLSPNEPRYVPELERELKNPIRRFYRAPMDKLQNALVPKVGETYARVIRYCSAKFLFGIAGIYAAAYYFKYNANDWTRKGGWRVVPSRKAVYPGHPDYPAKPDRFVGADYAARGFKESPI
ncbi:unnamed protein product [Nesidiocoris tenuis]|uniref:NADH dehydrogenase (Ubiquinone) 1 beta subcomplex, 6 n=2 Tax=Nesidiocoris tenuis TaxID=355587 RepID=A0ABN7ADZ8_9HEMI|nr:NADH dehydrogenase (ubiquinone) 1 beta subcomplex, 6 [Nesidiocoris tenuis]CAB0015264.1 unnamed protein product [Nesidiocoris tenuis]